MKDVMNMFRSLLNNKKVNFLFSTFMMILSAFLTVYVVQAFMDPCNLISGGFMGMSLLFNKVLALYGIDFPVWIGVLLFNTPAAILCGKYISKRFVFLSVLQYLLVSLFMIIFHFQPIFTDQILNILFGGFLFGVSAAVALRAGGSTGGTDFIAQYVALKIHRGIWDYVFFFNCIMYMIFGFRVGWIYAGYSIIFHFIATKTISSLYQRYSQITLEIYTDNPDAVVEAFMGRIQHGMTVFKGTGAYSRKQMYLCKSVVSVYEAKDAIEAVKTADENVIVNTYKTAAFYGSFHEQPL